MSRITLVTLRHDPLWDTPDAFMAGDVTRRGLGEGLQRRGHAVTVVAEADFDADRVWNGVLWSFRRPDPAAERLRALGRVLRDPWPAIRAPTPHMLRAVRETRPELIHTFDLVFYPHLVGLGTLGRPMVVHFHGGAAARRSAWRAVERRALSGADRLLFTTTEQAEPWVANGYPASQIREVFETSVLLDFGAFSPLENAPPESAPGSVRSRGQFLPPAKGGHVAGEPAIVCVGRLDAVKDPLTTVAGFELLLATHPGAVMHMCWTAAPLHRVVLAAARRLGAAVELHGWLPHDHVRALIDGASALVQSSTREVCGVAVLEAMALGVPPVVTDIPAFRAVLGDCGGRFAVGDAEGLATALRSVLADPTQPGRCRQRFDDALSFEALAATVDAIYEEIVPTGRAR